MKHTLASTHRSQFLRFMAFGLSLFAIQNPQAWAAVLIEDNFNRGSVETPLNLNGSTPTTSGIGSVIWNAAGWVTDGTQAVLSTAGLNRNGNFSYSLASGYIYTITGTIDVTETSGTSFIGLAFYQTLAGATSNILSGTDKQGILLRANGAVVGVRNGVGINLATGYSGVTTLSAILDTSASAWTLAFSINGSAVGSTQTFSTNPILTGFGFGVGSASGTVDNFSLTAMAVPEPSTTALGAAALGLIAVFGRRHQRINRASAAANSL